MTDLRIRPDTIRTAPPVLPGTLELTVLCVSSRPTFRAAVNHALAALDDPGQARLDQPWPAPEQYHEIVARAHGFVRGQLPTARLRVVHADSPALAALAFTAAGSAEQRLALLVVDADDADLADLDLGGTLDALPDGAQAELSPYGVYVYREPVAQQVQDVVPYTVRHTPDRPWVLAADIVCAVADHVEVRQLRAVPAAGPGEQRPSTVAAALADFLTARAGNTWGLFSYTGSVVSGPIADLERHARAAGNPILRGPSEHSLACGAMARWQLDGAPFLIVVTSAMVDELRGTLANLRQAGARGFVVCADSAADRWWPFQGTVHGGEDSRAVLDARRLRHVYLGRSSTLDTDLAEAFAAYDTNDGPVVLLATPSALEARTAPPPVPAAPVPVRPVAPLPLVETSTPGRVVRYDAFEAVVRMLNTERTRLLWQAGALDAEESELLHAAAAATGAALVDSLARPGTVSAYPGGTPNPHYLGTLGLYGFSARVADYLHQDGRLRPRTDQALFFLKSRLSEVSTPFSARTLSHGLTTVQVTAEAEHLAPFVDHPVHSDLRTFLRGLLARLDVDPEVLRWRRAAIDAARAVPDPLELLPVRPMTANYFYHHLNTVVEDLITRTGYTYTGVYDVGRGGAAAVRNVVRTQPGFSGWYGRALMGDALQAVPAIALSRPGNTLAFVGDGAAALVPDILPSLLQQLSLDSHRLRGNLSIFRLLNGGHSIIRTYQQARQRQPEIGQTTVLNLLDDDWTRTVGGVRVHHRRVLDVDHAALSAQLTEPGVVNLYSVLLSHNNEGDGLSLLTARSWHGTPTSAGPSVAGPRERQRP